MALYLDLKNYNGMDLSLTSSNKTSQSGTPQETNCERLQALATNIKKFAIIIGNFKSTINALRLNGIMDESDLTLTDNIRNLVHYGELHQLAVSEFSSHLPPVILPAVPYIIPLIALPLKTPHKDFHHSPK
ncbi:hypothetical protein TNCV_3535231 [Trichonephila clavipes]|nr:hypothetical protein TNCV_3535231 [Trichonephila clavipes]